VAALIAAQRDDHRVPHAVACRRWECPRSWFYKHKADPLPARAARRAALAAEVWRLSAAHRGTYGSPRITADLREAGWRVSQNTVAAPMREQGLAARRKRKRRATTRPGKGLAGPGSGQAGLPAQKINRKWYGDGTEIKTGQGKLYLLASVMDMASRRVLGFALGEHHGAALVYGALAMAVAVRRLPGARRHQHADRGSEYTAAAFRAACQRLSVSQSMGRPGSALDNAVIESWHSTLEFELRSVEHFATKAAARARVPGWIHEYNHARRHSACQLMSPVDYERALAAGEAA
jgi:putative transposase